MKFFVIAVLSVFSFAVFAYADDGLIRVQSKDGMQPTAERLQQVLQEKGFRLFAHVDHQASAKQVGKELRPTKLFIFGNPKAGTPLMQCRQSMAIDLPKKMLIYQDEQDVTWLMYNDPAFLASRHGLEECGATVVKKVAGILATVSQAAAGK